MTESEFLRRIDQHIAVSKQRRDLRRFIREVTRRNGIVLGELAAEASAGRQVLVDSTRSHRLSAARS